MGRFLLFTLLLAFTGASAAHAQTPHSVIRYGLSPEQLPAPIDQGWTLGCWAVTAGARFDLETRDAQGKIIQVSPRFILYQSLREYAIQQVLSRGFKKFWTTFEGTGPNLRHKVYLEPGGQLADAVDVVQRFGLVPESAYPKFPVYDQPLYLAINQLIDRYAQEHARSPRQFDQAAKTPEFLANLTAQVTAELNRHLGRPPETFLFQGKTRTPQEFRDQYAPALARPARGREFSFVPGQKDDQVTWFKPERGQARPQFTTGQQTRVVAALDYQLRRGTPVVLSYRMYDYKHTQRRGRIGFAVHGLTAPNPRKIDWNDPELLGHYVLAIAGEWSADGRLLRILVKNTWDFSRRAHFGYHWIEADYFAFFEGVEIREENYARMVARRLIPSVKCGALLSGR